VIVAFVSDAVWSVLASLLLEQETVSAIAERTAAVVRMLVFFISLMIF